MACMRRGIIALVAFVWKGTLWNKIIIFHLFYYHWVLCFVQIVASNWVKFIIDCWTELSGHWSMARSPPQPNPNPVFHDGILSLLSKLVSLHFATQLVVGGFFSFNKLDHNGGEFLIFGKNVNHVLPEYVVEAKLTFLWRIFNSLSSRMLSTAWIFKIKQRRGTKRGQAL